MTRPDAPSLAGAMDTRARPVPLLADDLARTAEYAAVQRPPAASDTWRRAVVAVSIAWLIIGGLGTLFRANTLAVDGGAAPYGAVLPSTALYVGLWLVLSPLILRAVVQWPLERPWWRWQTAKHAVLVAVTVGAAAAVQVLAYVWLATRLTGTVSIVNLDATTLDLAGRFEENLALGALIVIAWVVWRQRQLSIWRELQTAYLAAELSASRLQSLGMELRPHFLFNTLNAITGMVWADQATAERMILQLSELLRRTLEAGQSPTCSLREERESLELYLAIQRIRFGERLTIRVNMPDDTLDAEVPRFLLQPLVENAFQHGLAPTPGPVSLDVIAQRHDDRLRLCVRDDGAGLPSGDAIEESTGIGNSRRRLSTLYGAAGALTLRNRETGGVESCVEIPFRPTGRPATTGAEEHA